MPFLSTYIDVRTVNFFPPAESWLVNSNFPRARRTQGKKYTVNQGCMSLSTYYLEYGRHVARLHRHRRRRVYAPTSNTASHDNHEKINSWISFVFHIWDAYGAPLGSQSSAINRGVGINRSTDNASKQQLSDVSVYNFQIYNNYLEQFRIHVPPSHPKQ